MLPHAAHRCTLALVMPLIAEVTVGQQVCHLVPDLQFVSVCVMTTLILADHKTPQRRVNVCFVMLCQYPVDLYIIFACFTSLFSNTTCYYMIYILFTFLHYEHYEHHQMNI